MSQYVPSGSASPGDLELDVIFEVHGVSWLIIDEMFALELATYRRCFPVQPILLALQRNRRKCAHLLRDLAATADLPPRCALFSLQLLDLAGTHAGRLDPSLQASPLPLMSATTSTVSTPALIAGSSRRACSWCTKYC